MANKNTQGESGNVSRRSILAVLLFSLGSIFSITVFSRFMRRPSHKNLAQHGFPGTDSIFHPRNDAHLQEWLKQQELKRS